MRIDDEKKRPKRLASVTADRYRGVAILIQQGESRFLVLDSSLLASTNSLLVTELGTENSINYSDPELAEDSPLIRFKISGEPRVDFLTLAELSAVEPAAKILTNSDETLDFSNTVENAAVTLNVAGEVCGLRANGKWESLHRKVTWRAVKPSELRTQLTLLAQAKQSAAKGALGEKMSSELAATAWLTPYLKNLSSEILKAPEKPTPP